MRPRNIGAAVAIGACGSAVASVLTPAPALAANPNTSKAFANNCYVQAYIPQSHNFQIVGQGRLTCTPHATEWVSTQIQKWANNTWNDVGSPEANFLNDSGAPGEFAYENAVFGCSDLSGPYLYRTQVTGTTIPGNPGVTAWSDTGSITCS
jgi:hypothetical protein